MAEYVAMVDKILPGWDESVPDHPVASTDRFWEDDATVPNCPLIRAVLATAKYTLAAKQQEEQKLRALAIDAGCDVQALDEAIQKQHGGSPIGSASMELPTPPAAHRFAPARTSVEASNQLVLAHRQLTMSFKMAQCRAHRVLDKMDATIAALREAVNARKSMNDRSVTSDHDDNGWSVMIRHTDSFLTQTDREALQAVSDELCSRLRSRSSSSAGNSVSSDPSIAMLWQTECLKDNRTRAFVTDLAEAVRARLDASSGSDTEDSDATEAPVITSRDQSLQSSDSFIPNTTPTFIELEKVYKLICAQCEAGPSSEWDEQIRLDVTRTFGTSARRQHCRNLDHSSRSVCTPNGVTIPLEKRQAALQNVLRACASVDTEVGYCQGMDHVAALMLAVSNWNEARAFWLLVSLLASPRFELERLYGPGLPHLSLRCFQVKLSALVSKQHSTNFTDIAFYTSWIVYYECIYPCYPSIFKLLIFRSALLLRVYCLDAFPLQPHLTSPGYVITQSAKYDISDQMLKRLEKEFEQETPAAETPMMKARGRNTPLATENIVVSRNTNQRPQKRRTSLPPSYLRPEAQQEHQLASTPKRDYVSKASSSTRQASPSQMQSPPVV
ncbi:unnamed protein product [Phytophthora fragariaefolia]|uniref:Unnamed protein product n=1 Tax=Phytophthora fragariaefolia TaxID=1490495 RepID=A0A9W6XK98_9STRA|nr:unnamed protein product [Phytophthora fragariaefolia]